MNPFALISDPERRIPEAELQIDFVRSSGPGGQKVNKTSSKAQLRWSIEASPSFTGEEKALIRQHLANRINQAGEVVLASDRLRSQLQNKAFAIELLQKLVIDALRLRIPRRATRPTRASRERRLEEKKHRAEKKRGRRTQA